MSWSRPRWKGPNFVVQAQDVREKGRIFVPPPGIALPAWKKDLSWMEHMPRFDRQRGAIMMFAAGSAVGPGFVIGFTGSISGSVSGAAPQYVTADTQTDGDIGQRDNGGSFNDQGDWIDPKSKATDENSNYEVQITKSAGSDPSGGGTLLLNTYYTLDAARQWRWTQSGTGSQSFSGTMHIRPAGGGSVIDTTSVFMFILAF